MFTPTCQGETNHRASPEGCFEAVLVSIFLSIDGGANVAEYSDAHADVSYDTIDNNDNEAAEQIKT